MAIGDQKASRRTINLPGGSVDFGEGVGSALKSLGNTLSQTALLRETGADADAQLQNAYRARQERLQSANLQADLIRLDNEMARELSERYDAASTENLSARGFTDDTQAWARDRLNEFMRNVPDRLRPDFKARVQTVLQSKVNSAFQLQTSAENATFTNSVTELTAFAREEILSTPITDTSQLDALELKWMEQLEPILGNSPLAGPETKVLADQVMRDISSAKMVRVVQEEMLDNVTAAGVVPGLIRQRGRADVSERPVAAGMSRASIGFLMTTSAPESNNEYNRLYDGAGGPRYFDDYSKHPNSPTTITEGPHKGEQSTAAGKYMMIYSTWKRAKDALGLEDFSPENQDRAAWFIARQDYFHRTGRDLEAVLQSGNIPAIISAKRVLEGTWEGLKAVKDRDFVDQLAGATGNPSSTLYDAEFAHIPLADRLAIISQGQAQAESIRTELAAQYESERNAAIDELKRGILEDGLGLPSIQATREEWKLSVAEQAPLEKLYESVNEQKILFQQGMAHLEDNAFQFDPTNEDHKKRFSAIFEQARVGEAIAKGDEKVINDFLVPMVEKTGWLPPQAANQLAQQINSRDPAQARFALDTLMAIQESGQNAFSKAVSDDVAQQVALYKYGRGVLSDEELLNGIRDLADPGLDSVRKNVDSLITEMRNDDPTAFTGLAIARELGADRGVDPVNGPVLSAEYTTLLRYMLPRTRNPRAAKAAAIDVLSQRWGPQEIGGVTRVMRYPPNKEHPAFDGSHAYIEEQLYSDLGFVRGTPVELISDSTTDYERNELQQPPSYVILTRDDFNIPITIRNRDVAGFSALPKEVQERIGNLPARFTPQITDDMRLKLAEKYQRLNDLQIRRDEIQEANPESLDEVRALEAERNAVTEEIRRVREGLPIVDQGATGVPIIEDIE